MADHKVIINLRLLYIEMSPIFPVMPDVDNMNILGAIN